MSFIVYSFTVNSNFKTIAVSSKLNCSLKNESFCHITATTLIYKQLNLDAHTVSFTFTSSSDGNVFVELCKTDLLRVFKFYWVNYFCNFLRLCSLIIWPLQMKIARTVISVKIIITQTLFYSVIPVYFSLYFKFNDSYSTN